MGQESSPALLDQASELLAKKDVKLNTQIKTADTDEEIIVKDSPKKEHKTRVFVKKHTNNDKL